jgi:hypothetical protein
MARKLGVALRTQEPTYQRNPFHCALARLNGSL